MNTLAIDQLSAKQIAGLVELGLIQLDTPTQHDTVQESAHVDEHTAESVTDDVVNHRGQPCADANHPYTWTHDRLVNTAARASGRTDTLEAILRTFDGVNPIVIAENREIKDSSADHAVYHAVNGKGKKAMIAAIEWLVQHDNATPETATVLPSPNGAAIAKLQSQLRELNAENDTIAKMVNDYPALAHTVTERQAELETMIDQMAGELAELTDKSDTRSPYAKIVGVTPTADRKVKAKATTASLGRVNPNAFNEQAQFVLRRPSVLQERYENAKANAATLRKMLAERDEYLGIAANKDEKKAIRETFNEQLDALQNKIGYFSRAIEPTSIDRYQAYVWLKDGEVLPNAAHGTMPDKDALERKAVELNADPGKKQRSNNAKKAAKTRRKNARK